MLLIVGLVLLNERRFRLELRLLRVGLRSPLLKQFRLLPKPKSIDTGAFPPCPKPAPDKALAPLTKRQFATFLQIPSGILYWQSGGVVLYLRCKLALAAPPHRSIFDFPAKAKSDLVENEHPDAKTRDRF